MSESGHTTEPEPAPARRRGRPVNKATLSAIMDAAAALLDEGGLAAATIEAISSRSGVTKPTIYRHWPNRTAVAIDAFARSLTQSVPLPDSGDARQDLVELVCRVAKFYTTHAGTVMAQLMAAAITDPSAAAQLRERFYADRRAQTNVVWQRGVAAGQLRADITVEQAIDVLFSPIVFRMFMGHAPLTREAIAPLAEAALAGLAAGSQVDAPQPPG